MTIVARMEGKSNVHRVLVVKRKIKNPLGRCRIVRENNIKIDLIETR